MPFDSPYLTLLRNRINLRQIPFSERGSRLMVFRADDYLAVRLAERWFKREGQLSGYRRRPPLIDEWHFTDGEGRPLDFELTTYPHRVDCQTPLGTFTLTFVDSETLLVALPPGPCGMTFRANLDRAQTDRRGGVLRLTGDIRRNLAYTTNARLLENRVAPIDAANQQVRLVFDSGGGAALLLNITPRLGFNRWVPNPQAALEAAARRWHEWFAAAPEVAGAYRRQYYYAWWIMRAGLISSRFYTTREAMTPSKMHYVGVWQWDAYFHALAYRHVDMKLAQDQIRIVLDHQREDGMIPDAVHDEGTVTRLTFPVEADVTKPPLVGWAAWKLYETDGDREFLDEIYEPVVRWNNWWFEKNDVDRNGLCEYQHPYSSGLDDSPLWDDGVPVESPDLNTYLCLQQESLAKIAAAIGEAFFAELWARRAEAMARRMVKQMWDEAAGLFWARRPTDGTRALVRVRTPFNLFPLITGRMPPEIAARLTAHLADERQFWTRYPVPTVARDDPKYDPQTMWRGPTWVNVNYLLVDGLQRAGYPDLARELRRRTLAMMMQEDDIYEYYHPETGEVPPKAASIFGWSSALFIEMALEESRLAQKE
ncbi:MAG TPA: trehalase family glycosidase [Anaerolineales bacterium]|nr:trehalase family glycosidase [Anaerolineales bacterium]